jgi:hypothetical protein
MSGSYQQIEDLAKNIISSSDIDREEALLEV